MDSLNLDRLRVAGMRIVAGAMALLAGVTLVGELWVGAGGLFTSLLAVALPAYPIWLATNGRADSHSRMLATMTFVAQPALMLFVFRGMAWQVDLHMIFFAALAMTAMLIDWKALIGGAAVIAVHHLLLGMVVPDWVFLGGGGIARILMHAVILIGETVALVVLARQVVTLLDALKAEEAERARAAAAIEAERAARAAELDGVVARITAGLQLVADGDLTCDIESAFPPAYAALRTDFNRTLDSLRGLMSAIAASSGAIDSGATQIADASEDLARRTEANAAHLEETNAAIVQMDQRMTALARAAERTVTTATDAIATVDNGRSIATDAVGAMGRVSDSAKGIDSVIEGLDKIAFQTRVLAMNAAVEAGRAGEAGRGFAVVADLVSALAMRAEEEAKRARGQLTVTQEEIDAAVRSVERVDGVLNGISDGVGKVHTLLAQVAGENQAQASAIGEITSAIAAMDRTTQQTAAMVEQTSAAARNLTTEVTAMNRQAERFRVEASRRSPVARGTGSRTAATVH